MKPYSYYLQEAINGHLKAIGNAFHIEAAAHDEKSPIHRAMMSAGHRHLAAFHHSIGETEESDHHDKMAEKFAK